MIRLLLLLLGLLLLFPGLVAAVPIPRQLFVSVEEVREEQSPLLKSFYERERLAGWDVHFIDNERKTAFVETHFANSTFLWAYRHLSPRLGVAMADMWRLAVLYVRGGVYIDADGYLATGLDEILRRTNGTSLILTKERNVQQECYQEWHPLSRKSLERANPALYKQITSVYSNAVISSWAIFAAPGHPILRRAMHNIAALVRAEFNHHSALDAQSRGAGEHLWNRGRMVLCLTGPMLLTRTIYQHQMALNVSLPLSSPLLTVVNADYKIYGGNAKVTSHSRGNQKYYLHALQSPRTLFLSSYASSPNASIYDAILQQRSYGRPPPSPTISLSAGLESMQTKMDDLNALLRMLERATPFAFAALGPSELAAPEADACAHAVRAALAASNRTYVGIPCACGQSAPLYARALQLLNITLPPPHTSSPSLPPRPPSACPDAPPALDFRHALVPASRLTVANIVMNGNYWLAMSELARVLNQRARRSGRAILVFADNSTDPEELPFPAAPTLLHDTADAFDSNYAAMRPVAYLAGRGAQEGDVVLLLLGPLGCALAWDWARAHPLVTFLSIGTFYDQFLLKSGRLGGNAAKMSACMWAGDTAAGNLGTRDPLHNRPTTKDLHSRPTT